MNAEREQGFALAAVLWLITALSVLTLAAGLVARDALGASGNRMALLQAGWRAEGCMNAVRAGIARVLVQAAPEPGGADTLWSNLDRLIDQASLGQAMGCEVRLVPAGLALDVNQAESEPLTRLFVGRGEPPSSASAMAAALLDWRDSDDSVRPEGAERAWYLARRRRPPRNGPLADLRELHWVRGFEQATDLSGLLTVEPGRLLLTRAPLSVLATVPGFGEEALRAVERLRLPGVPFDLRDLMATLGTEGRDSLMIRFLEAARMVTRVPDAWICTVVARHEESAIQARMEVRIVLSARVPVIVRRRTWF